jgi:NADH-quinone oxidoreductase subunit C
MPTLDTLAKRFPNAFRTEAFRGDNRVLLPGDTAFATVFPLLKCLKEECGFDFLSDLGGVDYLGYPDATDRYAVVYALVNLTTGERLVVKAYTNDPDPELPSVVPLWEGANWMEREVFDLFGVRFPGHPDLRRILMPGEFVGHPLRKDYPLRGHGERHNFPAVTRAES